MSNMNVRYAAANFEKYLVSTVTSSDVQIIRSPDAPTKEKSIQIHLRLTK